MAHIGYYRSRRGWRRIKGFRVNSCRLSIHRLHVRFLDFIKLLRKWKFSYDKALKTLKKGIRSSRKRPSVDDGISRRGLVGRSDHKLKSYRHSNSFYAEAIADCLEFIKRSAVAIDDDDGDGSNSPTSPTSSALGGMA